MFDSDKMFDAYRKCFDHYQPDMYFNPGHALHTPGKAYLKVDCKQIKLPGHGISPHHSFQYVEGEYMLPEEYDEFLDDPTDYTIRKYMPRIYGELAPLAQIPPLKNFPAGVRGHRS